MSPDLRPVEPAIQTRGLTRSFGRLTAVDHIDLEIPRSQIYGFLGPNGSGKSTTIRMLCGLLTPTSGDVRVLGHAIPAEAEQLRQKVGYMTQRFSLYDDLSVRENLEFLGEIHLLPAPVRRRRVDELLDEYRLADRADQRAGTMSGGQRQRLALAGATLHEPDLLFLDEPTSAVDPQSRRDFWETLFELVDRGTTILVSTHLMDEAERCHGLAILDRGALVAEGTPRRLMDEVDATVVEIECSDVRRARSALDRLDGIESIAQLGTRLHALVRPEIGNPAQPIRSALAAAGLEAAVEIAPASLEDVFVAATRDRSEGRAA